MFSLKLDTQSVRELFPEGSEARLELQSAIIKNVVDSVVGKKISAEISERIHAEVTKQVGYLPVRDMVASAFSEYVSTRYGASTSAEIHPAGVRKLQDSFAAVFKKDADLLISSVIADGIEDAKQQLHKDEMAYIERVSANLQMQMRTHIKQNVVENFPDLINEIIKERLFPAAKS